MAANDRIQNTNTNISGTLLSILMSDMSNCMFFGILNRIKKLSEPGPVVLGRHLKKWPPTVILKTLISLSPEPLCVF